jgi:hypothetical protein
MNGIRMFAFFSAILITAFLLRAIADGFPSEPPAHGATAVHRSAAPAGPKLADRSFP